VGEQVLRCFRWLSSKRDAEPTVRIHRVSGLLSVELSIGRYALVWCVSGQTEMGRATGLERINQIRYEYILYVD
jgi:hypothetical protein